VNAIQKMDAFGMKAIAEAAQVDLVTVYRWRRALAEGVGILDKNKRVLVGVTAGSEHAITFADFFTECEPGSLAAAQ
jgi:hypothetical protein